jgi:uncharacterized protein (TIGR03437 family)
MEWAWAPPTTRQENLSGEPFESGSPVHDLVLMAAALERSQEIPPGSRSRCPPAAAATLPDGTLALPTGLLPLSTAVRGAKPGEVITLWANGLGPTSPAYPDGQVVTSQNRGVLTSTYSVLIGGKPAIVEYAGLVGSGLYQVNCLIPQIASGDATVVLSVAGASSQTAYIYVGQ